MEDVYHPNVLTSGNNEGLCVDPGLLLSPAGVPLTSQAGSYNSSSIHPLLLLSDFFFLFFFY